MKYSLSNILIEIQLYFSYLFNITYDLKFQKIFNHDFFPAITKLLCLEKRFIVSKYLYIIVSSEHDLIWLNFFNLIFNSGSFEIGQKENFWNKKTCQKGSYPDEWIGTHPCYYWSFPNGPRNACHWNRCSSRSNCGWRTKNSSYFDC